jgi:hypothetical protein
MNNPFTTHPNEEGYTYSQHFLRSIKLASLSFQASLVFTIHSLFPFWFTSNGSDISNKINKELNPDFEDYLKNRM